MIRWIRIIIIIFCIQVYGLTAFGQEMFGVVNSNYAGVNCLPINPGDMVNSKLYLDINLVTADLFFENNYLYIHKEDYKFLEFFKKNPDLPSYGEDGILFDHYWDQKDKNFLISMRLTGPSVLIVDRDNAIALSTSVRSATSIWKLPHDIANFAYEDLQYNPQHNIRFPDADFLAASLTWSEIGLSYARVINSGFLNRFTIGATVKRLFGHAGVYLKAHTLDYLVDSTDGSGRLDADIYNLDAEIGFSVPLDYAGNDINYPDNLTKGKGYSIDLGFTYQKREWQNPAKKSRKLCSQPYEDYLYKIGVSLLDLGYIRFNENAEKHTFDDVSNYHWDYINQFSPTSVNDMIRELNGRFYNGDSTRSLVANEFSFLLPTALSLQVDYHYKKDWYFNGTVVYPLLLGVAQIYRPPQLSVAVRYETRYLEFNLPVILYRFSNPRIGFSVRVWNVTIGSDNLGGFFSFSDFTGLDFYASLKLSFTKGICFSFKRSYGCQDLEF